VKKAKEYLLLHTAEKSWACKIYLAN